jgi:signal transduction histidine kinase
MKSNPMTAGISARATHRLMGRGIAAFCLLLLFQASGSIIQQTQRTEPWWDSVFLWGFLALVVASVIFSVRGWGLTPTSGALAGLVLVGLALWPAAVPATVGAEFGTPWMWAMINVGAAWCAFAVGSRLGCVYALLIGGIFAVVRTSPQGGGATSAVALQDALFATVLGLIICLTIGVLREAARKVDEAADEAISSYRQAASATALGNERLRLDGLLHDSVMTALVTAAQAGSADERLSSARLAANALERLELQGTATSEAVPASLPELAARIRFTADDAANNLSVVVTCESPHSLLLPADTVRAVFEATNEAVHNAARHSGAARCDVRLIGHKSGESARLRVTITDAGRGFRTAQVPGRRLGIRVSIIGRLKSVGGSAKVLSAPGFGTEVLLDWQGAAA